MIKFETKTAMSIGLHVEIVLDPDEWDWHIDCRRGAGELEIATAFAAAIALGMEIYNEEECEPDVLDDGTTRYWMSPKEAVDC